MFSVLSLFFNFCFFKKSSNKTYTSTLPHFNIPSNKHLFSLTPSSLSLSFSISISFFLSISPTNVHTHSVCKPPRKLRRFHSTCLCRHSCIYNWVSRFVTKCSFGRSFTFASSLTFFASFGSWVKSYCWCLLLFAVVIFTAAGDHS